MRKKIYKFRDLDLLALQTPPYKIRYIESDSPTAIEMTANGITRNRENLKNTAYARLLRKAYENRK